MVGEEACDSGTRNVVEISADLYPHGTEEHLAEMRRRNVPFRDDFAADFAELFKGRLDYWQHVG